MASAEWTILGAGIVAVTYGVVAAFYVRLGVHALRWAAAARRSAVPGPPPGAGGRLRVWAGAVMDIVLLRRLFVVNPALWLGEWLFHASLSLVLLRHLRYFTNPVPSWILWAQTPGWIAGFLLPPAVAYILFLRLLTRQEKFTSRANMLMLLSILASAVTGLLMSTRFPADLTAVKQFALGIVAFAPSPLPAGALPALHLGFALALLLFLPSHVFTAPLTLLDARRRDLELRRVLHDA